MNAATKRLIALFVVLSLCGLSACAQEQIVRPLQSQSPSSAPTVTPSAESAYPLELDSAALSEFDSALRLQENYGFLLSDYSDVRNVNLNELFYAGAGIEPAADAYEIRQNYESANPGEDWYDSDCDVLTATQLDDFLQAKTGYPYADMYNPLTWIYYAPATAYLHYHGDTNYIRVTCTAGRQLDENSYELDYTFDGGIYDENSQSHTEGTVTLQRSVISLQFLSNTLH